MTIPAAPLPEFKLLFKSLFVIPSEGQYWVKNNTQTVKFFSRGSMALAQGIQILLEKQGKQKGIVWFPAYFCNDALILLRKNNHQLYFYPVKKCLEPDWQVIENEINRLGCPDIFVLVHYFGFPNNLEQTEKFCKSHNIKLVEDAAHVLLPTNNIGKEGNMAVFSPRKLLPIPEGGLLVFPKEIESNIKYSNNKNNNSEISWLLKRVAQYLMMFWNIPWHRFQNFELNKKVIGNMNIEDVPITECGVFSRKIITVIEKEIHEIVNTRRNNYNLLAQHLTNIKEIRLVYPILREDCCPYMLPLLVVNKDRDIILRKLLDKGVFASSWPDLPPEVIRDEDEHKISVWLQKHILLFPIHQSLTEKQILWMSQVVHKIFEGSSV